MKTVRISIFLLSLVIGLATVMAQGPPGQIDAALNDLSARLERVVSVGHLSRWRWEEKNFADATLTCGAETGAGSGYLGYRFQLTYNAITYVYQVSHDSGTVVFCGELDANQTQEASAPAAEYVNRLCPESAEKAAYMRSRINAGMEIEASLGIVNLRAQPSMTAEILLQVPSGYPFMVAGGPDCAEGVVWWYALASGQTGYVAEGHDGAYLVEPQRPAQLPSREALHAGNAQYTREVARVRGNFLAEHSWSTDGKRLALPGAIGSDGIWIYDLDEAILTPEILEMDEALTAIEFRPNSDQLLFGSEDGSLHLWELRAEETSAASERLYFNAHDGAISAIAFSPEGDLFASAAPLAYTELVADRQWAVVLFEIGASRQRSALSGHDGVVRAIAFSQDGGVVSTGGDDGVWNSWSAANGAHLARLSMDAPVTALAYSPDGLRLAVGLARTSENVLIYDVGRQTPTATFNVPSGAVTTLAFSPDSSLLASGAADAFFTIWNVRSHQSLMTTSAQGAVGDISFSPDGTLIAVSTDESFLALYAASHSSG